MCACQLFVLQDVSADAANRCKRWGVGFGTTLLFDRVSHEEVPRTAWQTKSSLAIVNMGLKIHAHMLQDDSFWLQTQPLTLCLA